MPKTDVTVELLGDDGNIFSMGGKAGKAMRRAGHGDLADEMYNRIKTEAKNYDHAIQIIMEYVEVE